MTTNVTIDAHCDGETKEVVIKKTGEPDVVIQDGETHKDVVYDEISITVIERLK